MNFSSRKATPEEQAEMIRLYRLDDKPRWSCRMIGERMGFSTKTVWRIITKQYSDQKRPARLSDEMRRSMRDMLRSGMEPKQVSKVIGTSPQLVRSYKRELKEGQDGGLYG